jgi:hypothetical protein
LVKLPTIPARLSKIDSLTRREHFYLTEDDDCYFLWEWDAAPYSESATTNFIGNFQKDPRFREKYWPWHFKLDAIQHAANAIIATLTPEWKGAIFVPIPPSKIKADVGHDSRLMDTLRLAKRAIANAHEIVLQINNTNSRQKEVSANSRAQNWMLDASSMEKTPRHFVVFDDLLTGGSHFAAMKIVLARRFPDVPVSGLFLARRVLASQIADPRI